MSDQQYLHGDAVIDTDGRWLCEHEASLVVPPPVVSSQVLLTDPGSFDAVTCPDCGAQWRCWTRSGQRLAKIVVHRVQL